MSAITAHNLLHHLGYEASTMPYLTPLGWYTLMGSTAIVIVALKLLGVIS